MARTAQERLKRHPYFHSDPYKKHRARRYQKENKQGTITLYVCMYVFILPLKIKILQNTKYIITITTNK